MAVTGSGCSIPRNLVLSSEAFTCTSPIPFKRSQNYATITTMAILLNASSCSSPRGLCLIFENFNESSPASLELPCSYASQAAYSNKTNFKLILSGIGMLEVYLPHLAGFAGVWIVVGHRVQYPSPRCQAPFHSNNTTPPPFTSSQVPMIRTASTRESISNYTHDPDTV